MSRFVERDRARLELPGAFRAESVERVQLVGGGRDELDGRDIEAPLPRRRPRARRRGGDLVVGPAAHHRLRMVLGIPPLDRVVVTLVEDQPLGLAVAFAGADQHEVTAQLRTVELEVQLAGIDRGPTVGLAVERERAAIPHDDVARAVAARRDHTLEVEVLDRVVLDVHREVPHLRVQRRTFRYRPAHEHTVDLQPEVVVEPTRPVTLDDEARRTRRRCRHCGPGRLGRPIEVPLLVVAGQARFVGLHRYVVPRMGPRNAAPGDVGRRAGP